MPPTPLADLTSTIDAFAEDVLADPVALDPERLDEIDAVLDASRQQIGEAEALHADLAARLDAARRLLAELDAASEAGREARVDALMKVAGAEVVDPIAGDHGALRDLDRAAALANGGDWAAGAAALARWHKETDDLLQRERTSSGATAYHSSRATSFAAASTRSELRVPASGDSRTRSSRRVSTRPAPLLYTVPTDLALAADLVRRYQLALAAPRLPREAST